MIAAPASGSGKTTVTCGILGCLKERNRKVTAFKCGPDYIDPMFHREVLGIESYNLDTFLCGRAGVRKILTDHSKNGISVIEGVMGYYDGLGGVSTEASAYDVADATQTPVVLLVDGKGTGNSIVALIRGFLGYREKDGDKSHIRGIILNRISGGMYERMKELIERETSVKVYGYVPALQSNVLESRHLGLKMPHEREDIKERLSDTAREIEKTVDLDGLIRLAELAPDIDSGIREQKENDTEEPSVRIAVARDEAFCFIYPDNLEYLKKLGAQIVPFSPVADDALPENIQGVIFYGGYPELYAEQLAANVSMRRSVKEAVDNKMPCIAECGGFLYLQEILEDLEGNSWPMCGVLPGKSRKTDRLKRFGYAYLTGGTVFGRDVGKIPVHEFHYYDSTDNGDAFTARKPMSERTFSCMVSTDYLLAGYPHFYYPGNPQVAEAFVSRCAQRNGKLEKREDRWN